MQEVLSVYCDGGSRGNPGMAAAAFVILDEQDKEIAYTSSFIGRATNNFAEYSAVLLAFRWLVENLSDGKPVNKDTYITFYLDSQLVTNQLLGNYKIKEKTLLSLAQKIKQIERNFSKVVYKNIPRAKNKRADLLVNRQLDEAVLG